MTTTEAARRQPNEAEVVTRDCIINYLSMTNMQINSFNIFAKELIKQLTPLRHFFMFYNKCQSVENTNINIKTGETFLRTGYKCRKSTGIFNNEGILLFVDDIVYCDKTKLFYVIRKVDEEYCICREGCIHNGSDSTFVDFDNFKIEEPIVSNNLKFVASLYSEREFFCRYILGIDNKLQSPY